MSGNGGLDIAVFGVIVGGLVDVEISENRRVFF
jgi:hypothetical protein